MVEQICKGCGNEMGRRNALSRYDHGDICPECGTLEAFYGDFITRYQGTAASPKDILMTIYKG